jgi:hypothetical protein
MTRSNADGNNQMSDERHKCNKQSSRTTDIKLTNNNIKPRTTIDTLKQTAVRREVTER